ncbi:PTS sugar transporter subunit IID [Synergistales bacterium]|nr:PTS sugar transporter subunit IID [Synergistales bacterium]
MRYHIRYPRERVSAFLKKKDISFSARLYGVDAFGAMAQGLFASILIGTIFETLGEQFGLQVLMDIGACAKAASGPTMAVAIGYALKCPPLVLFSLVAVGEAANILSGTGGALAVSCMTVAASECGKAISKETKIDIIMTPCVTISVGILLSMAFAQPVGNLASFVGNMVMWATELWPFLMGVALSAAVGLTMTLPVSGAALCAALGLSGLAGGAALAGCCAQMVGFAAMSMRENGWGGFFAQGLGTSMLQMGNVSKNPRIWIPPILTSMVAGPLATCVFKIQMNGPSIAAGMGTSGLVGPIGIYSGWLQDIELGLRGEITSLDYWSIILIYLMLPAVLTPLFAAPLRKIGWIKEGDLDLHL